MSTTSCPRRSGASENRLAISGFLEHRVAWWATGTGMTPQAREPPDCPQSGRHAPFGAVPLRDSHSPPRRSTAPTYTPHQVLRTCISSDSCRGSRRHMDMLVAQPTCQRANNNWLWPAGPCAALQMRPRPVLDGLGQVSCLDGLRASEIGDGPAQLEHPVEGPGAHL